MDRCARSDNLSPVGPVGVEHKGANGGRHPVGPPLQRIALASGVLSPAVYIGTDLLASFSYEGYSFRDQAVSELFAIGAPTAALVVGLFTCSSLLLAMFGLAIWTLASSGRLRLLAVLVLANAANSLVLWNAFPMHMRGVQPTFTDTMHAVLAVNPFVLGTIIVAAAWSFGWFRAYSVATVFLTLMLALAAFYFVPLVVAQDPTPWMGIAERAGQYIHQTWLAVLALVLLNRLKFPEATIRG